MIRLLLANFLLLLGHVAAAQAPGSLVDIAQSFAQREASQQLAAAGAAVARIEVSVGTLDSRFNLAPCQHAEAFLPNGVRLWGRSSVGVRCLQGANWSVLIPVNVRVFGTALVASRPLVPAQLLSAQDVAPAEVELARDSALVTDVSQLANRVLVRPIGVGGAIPMNALRLPQVVSQGDPVKLIGQGQGFAITAEATALSAAHDGQAVRVRTDSGRILTGIARSGRVVELSF